MNGISITRRTLAVNDIEMYCETRGEGEALVPFAWVQRIGSGLGVDFQPTSPWVPMHCPRPARPRSIHESCAGFYLSAGGA